ncbi:hypothetical protein [Sphingobium boeckii]|uniref:Uncharacterized protein n=1 Tax=Sphingobium boeckii TaxID=1082345 RepID=A0A7W9EDX4_9SPHN|nr:hypothetical protein [Sphingobium boeckii]MBB5685384.1 hypothetical protein [Sphingobium boeckii]
MKIKTWLAILCAWACIQPVIAQSEPAGRYRLSDGPDVASELILTPDGHFRYFLAAGALDEQAEGEWTSDGSIIRLTTVPTPVPPAFAQGAAIDAEDPYFILVTWPNGRGIAGIDLRIGFDSGDPIEAYTQSYGWNLPDEETRNPRWIELSEPMHGLASPRFPVDDAKRFRFILTPNDLGIVDFRNAIGRLDGDTLQLERAGGTMKFVRTDKSHR